MGESTCPWRVIRIYTLLTLSVLSACLMAFPVTAEEPVGIGEREGLPVVHWEDAHQFTRQRVIVFGEVVAVGGTQNIQFLNFSKTDRSAFKVVIFARSFDNFPEPLDQMYNGKKIEVEGHVTLFQSHPQIVISHPRQIRIVTEFPEPHRPVKPAKSVSGNTIRVATCNALNLFDAYDDPYTTDEATPEKPRAELQALAENLRLLNADVIAFQEVENRGILTRFLEVFLPDMGYQHVVLIEGNDSRGIDVAVASRIPIGPVTSHAYMRFADPDGGTDRFQRDFLRVTIEPPGGQPFDVYVVHLKSKSGEDDTEPIRMAEARQIRKLLDQRLAADPDAAFLICGDFNDEMDSRPLQVILGTGDRQLVTLFGDVPAEERITYNQEPYRSMIDFIICSPGMAQRYVSGSYEIRPGSVETSGSDHNVVSCQFQLAP